MIKNLRQSSFSKPIQTLYKQIKNVSISKMSINSPKINLNCYKMIQPICDYKYNLNFEILKNNNTNLETLKIVQRQFEGNNDVEIFNHQKEYLKGLIDIKAKENNDNLFNPLASDSIHMVTKQQKKAKKKRKRRKSGELATSARYC